MAEAATDIDLSIVVPVYDEAENIEPLYSEIAIAVAALERTFEIVFVDDGSTDSTFDIAKRIADQDGTVRVIRLKRNYGQSAATQAGFDQSAGKIILVMDGDLQNDPRDIGRLLAEIDEGYDIVCGWRKMRKDHLITRRLPSRVANSLIHLATGIDVHDNGCSLRAYRRETVEHARLYSGFHRFILPLVAMAGCCYKEVIVNHRPRRFGRSKYGLSRIWKVVLDLIRLIMISRFSSRPAHWFGMLSLPALLLAILCLLASVYQYLTAERLTYSPVVYLGSACLFTFAFLHLILMAIIGDLVVWTGDHREEHSLLVRRANGEEADR